MSAPISFRLSIMKNLPALIPLLAFLAAAPGCALQQGTALDLTRIADGKTWKTTHATAQTLTVDGKQAVRLQAEGDSANRIAGLSVASGTEFTTGVIEVDLKGKNLRQQSFLGVAFNVADERTFEAVYFRPFNFKAEEPFRLRAVQYIAWPEYTWETLRKAHPGQFEKPVNPVPDPDGWFHARIEVKEQEVRVFVDAAPEPSLVVQRLAKGNIKRPVGLFVDVAEGLYANLEIKPN